MGKQKIENTPAGYLLDTHTFLWAARNPLQLGKQALDVVENSQQRLYLSAVSAYELCYKHQLGKLAEFDDIVDGYAKVVEIMRLINLPINYQHAYRAGRMQWLHRDPFDRILAAQATIENLILITNDAVLTTQPWLDTVW